jgi:uncharacterized membrane protein HdeD (DUF308 family)
MKLSSIVLIVIGLIIIANPAIIAYILGWLLVFIGCSMLLAGLSLAKRKDAKWEEFVKFGNYKIYR